MINKYKTEKHVCPYAVSCEDAKYPACADSFTVIYLPTGEAISHHESPAEARAAIRRYEAADARRKYMKLDA